MGHPWMNRGLNLLFSPAPFPNKLKLDDIEEEIVEHMVHILRVRSVDIAICIIIPKCDM